MKYLVLVDREQTVVAAGPADTPPVQPEPDSPPQRGEPVELPEVRPVPSEGQDLIELEVPDEYAELDPDELFKRLRDDIGGRSSA